MRYCVFGRALESDEPLPELPPARASAEPRFTVSWHASVHCPSALRWRTLRAASGVVADVSIARADDLSFLRVAGLATAAFDRRRIAVAVDPAADRERVRHALLDQILPLALAADGETVLHASAVEADGAALLFLGSAGSGKSTLAAALSACGAGVMADDSVLLELRGEAGWAVPSYRGLRLWPDAAECAAARGFSIQPGRHRPRATAKYRLLPVDPGGHAQARPVAAAYTLATGAAVAFTRLSRRDAALELVRHAFLPDVDSRATVLAHTDRATSWSGRLQIWRLDAPRDLTRLPGLARAVLAHAGSCGVSARLPANDTTG
jgi:hypothetical protein